MARDDSFSTLSGIVSQALDYPEGGAKNSQIKTVLDLLFDNRYHSRSRPKDAFRDAYALRDEGVPWAGVIAPENPSSGAYGGASIAWFPCEAGTLMTLVVGTKGLAPARGCSRVMVIGGVWQPSGAISPNGASPLGRKRTRPRSRGQYLKRRVACSRRLRPCSIVTVR